MAKLEEIGNYLLRDQIAVGGMAKTFKAVAKTAPDKPICLKVMHSHLCEDDEFVKMFIDEASIALSLEHENIVRVFDFDHQEGQYYLAMELVEGRDLKQVMERAHRRGTRMTAPMAVLVVTDVCAALDYVHAKKKDDGQPLNIIHRDISPHNVMVSFDGDVKITDFGIAKAASRLSNTRTGAVKGKRGYMSPEQARGMKIDSRSDIFAAGILMFELLTGERLFQAESAFEVFEKILEYDIPAPSSHVPNLDKTLDRICLKALERDRDKRYSTAGEMVVDLEAWFKARVGRRTAAGLDKYVKTLFDLASHPLPLIGRKKKEITEDIKAVADLPTDIFDLHTSIHEEGDSLQAGSISDWQAKSSEQTNVADDAPVPARSSGPPPIPASASVSAVVKPKKKPPKTQPNEKPSQLPKKFDPHAEATLPEDASDSEEYPATTVTGDIEGLARLRADKSSGSTESSTVTRARKGSTLEKLRPDPPPLTKPTKAPNLQAETALDDDVEGEFETTSTVVSDPSPGLFARAPAPPPDDEGPDTNPLDLIDEDKKRTLRNQYAGNDEDDSLDLDGDDEPTANMEKPPDTESNAPQTLPFDAPTYSGELPELVNSTELTQDLDAEPTRDMSRAAALAAMHVKRTERMERPGVEEIGPTLPPTPTPAEALSPAAGAEAPPGQPTPSGPPRVVRQPTPSDQHRPVSEEPKPEDPQKAVQTIMPDDLSDSRLRAVPAALGPSGEQESPADPAAPSSAKSFSAFAVVGIIFVMGACVIFSASGVIAYMLATRDKEPDTPIVENSTKPAADLPDKTNGHGDDDNGTDDNDDDDDGNNGDRDGSEATGDTETTDDEEDPDDTEEGDDETAEEGEETEDGQEDDEGEVTEEDGDEVAERDESSSGDKNDDKRAAAERKRLEEERLKRLEKARQQRAYLAVRAVPWADVYVSGKRLGRTPLKKRMKPGSYTVLLQNPEIQRATRKSVKVEKGKTTVINHRF